jgi:hypothetical protein
MRRKPRRSRRRIKKLLRKGFVPHPNWNIDAVICGGRWVVSYREMLEAA